MEPTPSGHTMGESHVAPPDESREPTWADEWPAGPNADGTWPNGSSPQPDGYDADAELQAFLDQEPSFQTAMAHELCITPDSSCDVTPTGSPIHWQDIDDLEALMPLHAEPEPLSLPPPARDVCANRFHDGL